MTIRVGLDATPLLGRRTGIGVYVARLVETLAQRRDELELVATAFSLRGAGRLSAQLPAGVRSRSRPVPAGVLLRAWERVEAPPVEAFCGKVDVFHGTNFVLPPMRRARGVVTVHDLSFVRYPDTVSAASAAYRDLVPRSIRRAAVVCTLSQATADEVAAEYGVDRAAIVVTSPGVDPVWFTAVPPSAAQRTHLNLPPRYILAVGTLEPRKNLPVLIAAHAQLRAIDSTTPPLVLTGPPGWGPALHLDDPDDGNVVMTGYLDDATLRAVVAGAACLAFPSIYEGFGIPPLEALACGVPVVASDLPVTREVLGTAASLVPPSDVDALAAALAAALEQPTTAEDVRRRREQAARWTWSACADAAELAYRRALAY